MAQQAQSVRRWEAMRRDGTLRTLNYKRPRHCEACSEGRRDPKLKRGWGERRGQRPQSLVQLMQGPQVATTTFADWLNSPHAAEASDIATHPVIHWLSWICPFTQLNSIKWASDKCSSNRAS